MQKLKKEIDKLLSEGKDLFYNSTGNKHAYKWFVRHLSYAPVLGYGKIERKVYKPNTGTLIVNFETKKIETIRENINFVKLG